MTMLSDTTRQLIQRLGETDQQARHDQSLGLASERAQIRQNLAAISQHKTEQLYLLGEAAALLESAVQLAEQQQIYNSLSAQLADLYLQFFSVTHEQRYLIIVGQILKPLSHSDHPAIGWHLLRLHALSAQPALTRYWLSKLLKSGMLSWAQLYDMPELNVMRQTDWFIALQQRYQH